MNDTVGAVLEEAFPGRRVAGIDGASDDGHPGNHTARIRFGDGSRVFLKLREDGDAERNRRETAAAAYASAHCGVRVPEVVASDSAFDPPYLATAPLGGTPASGAWDRAGSDGRERIAREVGRAVGEITAARFDEHGWITGGDTDHLDRETGPWSAVLADAVERDADAVPYPDRFADVPGRVADLLRSSPDVLDGAPPALLHQDPRPENVFLNGRAGVLDWEWTLAGDPALGLCWGEAWTAERADVPASDRDRLRGAVRHGYRERVGGLPDGFDRRRPLYRVVTFLPKPKTFDSWAPAAPEPTPGLAEWVRRELDERIAAAGRRD